MTGLGEGEHRRNRRLKIEWWLVAFLSTALVVGLVAMRATARIDNIVYDALLRIDEHPPRYDILIVAIDNHSLAEAGQWPWPRDRHAALIDILARAQVRAIAYDVLFVEPSTIAADQRLGQAVARAPVFLPLLMRSPGTNGAPFDAIKPISPLEQSAAGIGQVNLTFDDDGLVRRVSWFAGDDRQRWPHLMALMWQHFPSAPPGNRTLPNAQSLIAYAGAPGQFPTISAASVLRGEVPPEMLKNRLILVGATADGLGDQYPTPLAGSSGVMSGIEIQANMLDALLAGRMIRPTAMLPLALLSVLPLWLLLFAFLRLAPRNTVLVLVALVAFIGAATGGAFFIFHLWVPPVAALVGLIAIYPLWGWRRLAAISAYMVDELDRLRVEHQWLSRADGKPAAIDLVGRQASLLQGAIARIDDMRRFAIDRLQQMPDSTFVTDLDGQIVLTNREAQRLCSETGIACTGNIHALLDLMQGVRSEEQSLLRFPVEPMEQRSEGRLEDGRSFDLRVVPQQAVDGQYIGWIVRAIDVTQARANERQREEVLQLLSHDMRSPQTSIIAALDTAKEGAISSELAGRVRAHAERTLKLSDGFVQLARAESLVYEMEEVDLGDLVIEAADNLWEQSSRRRIEMDLSDVREGIVLTGERTLLTRALGNLLDNAVKYSSDGGRVTCRIERQGSTAVCVVEDHGIGIAPDQVERMFEQFRRAPGADSRRIDGAGLGLAFIHTVAVRHGGSIRCDSVPGKRTTFTLTLPLQPPHQRDSNTRLAPDLQAPNPSSADDIARSRRSDTSPARSKPGSD